MSDVSNQRPNPPYTANNLSRQAVKLAQFARHKAIENALTDIGYRVKPYIVAYPPGRAVLPRVIVRAN